MPYLVYKTLTNARFERVHGKQILDLSLLVESTCFRTKAQLEIYIYK